MDKEREGGYRRVERTCAPVAGVYDHEGRRRFESFFFGRTARFNNCGPVPAEGRAEDELDFICGSEFGFLEESSPPTHVFMDMSVPWR